MKITALIAPSLALLAIVFTAACQSSSELYDKSAGLSDNLFGPPAVGQRAAPAPAAIAASRQRLNVPAAAPTSAPYSEASFQSQATANPVVSSSTSSTGESINPYAKANCLVCDRDLESMGGSVSTKYGTQEIKVCSPSCNDDFHADPITHLIKL